MVAYHCFEVFGFLVFFFFLVVIVIASLGGFLVKILVEI